MSNRDLIMNRTRECRKAYPRAIAINGPSAKFVSALVLLIAAIGAAHAGDQRQASFPLCGAGKRVTCLVDGDTFWLDGVKIRIADIDAPEVSKPACEKERLAAEAATQRLSQLLNAGPFTLVAGDRDEDRYGRKLRIVVRKDVSIGEILVSEGFARHWNSPRVDWCR